MNKTQRPSVTVLTITYNQERYIRDALEGFVTQQADTFDFEVLIGDDGSTDETRSIIQEYADKYPNIIKPVFRSKNLGSMPNFVDLLRRAKSTYIALCEGDDYWTDPKKLHRQVTFLEAHPAYAVCFHPVRVVFEDSREPDAIFPEGKDKRDFSLKELLNQNYIQTNSVMYRRQNYDAVVDDIVPGDWYMHLYHARFGKVGFIDKEMAVYRRHAGGIWWGALDKQKAFWSKYALDHLRLYRAVYNLFQDSEHKAYIDKSLARIIDTLAELQTQDPSMLDDVIRDFPDLISRYIAYRGAQDKQHQAEIDSREERIAELYGVVADHREHITKLELEIQSYQNTILNRLRRKTVSGVRRVFHKNR